VLWPLTALYASAKAMDEMFRLLMTTGTTTSALDRLMPFQQFHDVIGLDGYYALAERYSGAHEGPGPSEASDR